VHALFDDPAAFDAWAARWRERLTAESQDGTLRAAAMRRANPAYIPRNHRVEAALSAATERGDYAPFEELVSVLSRPYDEQPGMDAYGEPPGPEQRVYKTFCGT